MLKTLLLLSLLPAISWAADCSFKNSDGSDYEVTKKGNVMDVVTNGAGWMLNLDANQSKNGTSYYIDGSMLLVESNSKISLYSYSQKFYYFKDQPCSFRPPIEEGPAGYIFGGGSSSYSGGAVAMPGGSFTPLPPGPGSSYQSAPQQFTPPIQITNPMINGIACQYANQATHCVLDTGERVVLHYDKQAEYTAANGTRYLLPKNSTPAAQIPGISQSARGFCEVVYAIEPNRLAICQGSTDGVNLFIIQGGTSSDNFYEFPGTLGN